MKILLPLTERKSFVWGKKLCMMSKNDFLASLSIKAKNLLIYGFNLEEKVTQFAVG